MEFRLLGPLEVSENGTPIALGGAKQRAVLAHLLLRANTLVPAERLIDEVWGDDPPAAARNVLQTYVSRLRKALGDERLARRPGGYLLRAEPPEIDALRYRALVDEARRKAPIDPDAAVALYREAEELWRAPALDDLADQPSLRADIAHLEELRAAATEERIVAELSLGRHAELVPELEALTAHDPLREALWAHLMTALYRSGRQADALAAYRRARAVLVEELGLEPSAELRRLEQQVLEQDPALATASRPLRGFQVLERVGEGSFGVVHRALQPQVGREVAVKVVRPALANDPEFIRRFEAEAQLVARLEHPHIVPLYDYWREPDGAYLVMRFLRGGTLRDALDRGPLPLDRALGVVEQVGGALTSAHRQGIVHRDVKPANILFDEERNAYLSDFGIARDATAARSPERVASTASSAYYISPEESRGEEPTARADIYSLGLVLHEMLGGDRAELPASIGEIVRTATRDDPADRYPDVVALIAALADAARPAAATVAVPSGPPRNPYKGLRAFLEPDAADFRGRERLVARLVERLAGGPDARLLALVGPSGSGKSSAVRAGLVPALRGGAVPGSEHWFVAEMTPGRDPFAELATALVALARTAPPPDLARRLEDDPEALGATAAGVLPDDGSELVLLIDQFEELFTLTVHEERRAAFLAALRRTATDPRSRVRIVLTLRADFFDRPLAHAGFAEVLRAGTELILPLDADELGRAISGPAERVGVTVESGLLAALVSDTAGQPGALPLLQFTLAELFDRRRDGALTLAAYRELGGVGGAVARGAEEIHAALTPEGSRATRELFLRLVDHPEGTRRRVLRSEVTSLSADMDGVTDAFAARRLLSFDRDPMTREPTVEIAHDALLHAWERLRDWLDDAREDLRMQRQLAAGAAEWREAGRDPSFLLRGARLDRAATWRPNAVLALTPAETEFLDASLAEQERVRAQESARASRERELELRSMRRLRVLVAVLATAALVAAALTIFALDQRSEAIGERRVAVARELAAAAAANLDADAERSILLALEAIEHTRPAGDPVLPEAEDALHRAVGASRIVRRVPGLGGWVDWGPRGRFVTEGPEESGIVDVRDTATGRSLRRWRGHRADVNAAVFSADGTQLATSADDGTLRVWDPSSGKRLHGFDGLGDQVWGVSFSPDGTLLAASSWASSSVRIWDLRGGRLVREVRVSAPSLTTRFGPDGRRLAIATFDEGGVVVDVRTGDVVHRLAGQGGVADIDYSPDGRWISTTSFDSTVRIWDARTGRTRFTLGAHKSEVIGADWHTDSRRLVTGSNDGTVRVWEVDTDGVRELVVIPAQERGGGLMVAFSPDGRQVMTGDQAITAVKIWDVGPGGGAEWANVPAAAGAPSGVAFTADGAGVVTSRADGRLAVRDVRTARSAFTLGGGGEPASVVDVGRHGLIAGARGETVRVWDPATRRETFAAQVPGGVADVAWSRDGSRLAVAGFADGVRILDRAGRRLAVLAPDPGFSLNSVRFSPDGRYVATSRVGDRPAPTTMQVTIWDWRRGRVVRTLREAAEAVAFSRDGTRIAAAAYTGPVRIWDVRSGRVVLRLAGHTGAVNDVAFSPDGSLLATASTDGTVRVWDAGSGRQRLVLRGHDGAVWDVAFSPDGSKLASSSPEGIVRVWALDLDDLIAIARRNVSRGLTREECRQYVRERRC